MPVLVFTGAAPRRVSTSGGKELVSQICDSNRESQITSDLRQREPSQTSSLTCCTGIGVAILTAI